MSFLKKNLFTVHIYFFLSTKISNKEFLFLKYASLCIKVNIIK